MGRITSFAVKKVRRAATAAGERAATRSAARATAETEKRKAAEAAEKAAAEKAAAAKAAARRKAAAEAAKRKAAAEKAAAEKAAAATPAIITSREGTPQAVAQDVLREAAAPSKGAPSFAVWRAENPDNGQLLDLSNLSVVPNVPQFQIPRTVPARGAPARIVEALANPEVEQGINETVMRGIEGGGKEWYNTEPIRQRMLGALGADDTSSAYPLLMDLMAATSPRARVPDNVRTGSYYNYVLRQGLPIPEKPAAGYGSIAQNLHRQNVEGLVERGGWDIYANPKPASFSSNLQGNQQVATIDTHNFRLPGILSGDPRFLETSVAELTKSPEIGLETLMRQYPGLPEEVARAAITQKPGKTSINYRPQEWVEKGYIPMEDAVNDPALWASKPRDNEYGYYEGWQQGQAKKLGISPAQYQASMWLGGGDTTGLGSAAEPFAGTFEARVRYTADRLGLSPEKVLDMMLRGEIPLLAQGGSVDAKSLAEKYQD